MSPELNVCYKNEPHSDVTILSTLSDKVLMFSQPVISEGKMRWVSEEMCCRTSSRMVSKRELEVADIRTSTTRPKDGQEDYCN